jgi:type II secretory pathway pseudopilin PulG
MNITDLSPEVAAAKAAGRDILVVVIVIVAVVGLITAVRWVNDPLGLGKAHVAKVETQATVNSQQAASNAAGAAINDSRATNVAQIHKTGQEARHAVQQSTDQDDAVRRYLDGLERVRRDGAAVIADPAADGG